MEEAALSDFEKIRQMINVAQKKANYQVNQTLINLYWQIGKFISDKTRRDAWGRSTVKELSTYILKHEPNAHGYSEWNIWRMKRFYETYAERPELYSLLCANTWSNNLHILVKCKDFSEREFYLKLAAEEKYSARELERQIDSGYYERLLLSSGHCTDNMGINLSRTKSAVRDSYVLEFLNLPDQHREYDLKHAIVNNMKSFILEVGHDFTFMGEEYRIQVGGNDYFIDLLFYNRELRCLVAFELKIDDFKPEYAGKMSFYLEALDRIIKKDYENPSVGIILCKSKEREVVEFTMNKNLSKTMVAEYHTKLIDKEVLRRRLSEIYNDDKFIGGEV